MKGNYNFDEDLFEDTYNNKNNIKDKFVNKSLMYDDDFKNHILNFSEKDSNYCNQEMNSFNKCYKKIINTNWTLPINKKGNINLIDLEKECLNEMIFVYNCLKRYGRFI